MHCNDNESDRNDEGSYDGEVDGHDDDESEEGDGGALGLAESLDALGTSVCKKQKGENKRGGKSSRRGKEERESKKKDSASSSASSRLHTSRRTDESRRRVVKVSAAVEENDDESKEGDSWSSYSQSSLNKKKRKKEVKQIDRGDDNGGSDSKHRRRLMRGNAEGDSSDREEENNCDDELRRRKRRVAAERKLLLDSIGGDDDGGDDDGGDDDGGDDGGDGDENENDSGEDEADDGSSEIRGRRGKRNQQAPRRKARMTASRTALRRHDNDDDENEDDEGGAAMKDIFAEIGGEESSGSSRSDNEECGQDSASAAAAAWDTILVEQVAAATSSQLTQMTAACGSQSATELPSSAEGGAANCTSAAEDFAKSLASGEADSSEAAAALLSQLAQETYQKREEEKMKSMAAERLSQQRTAEAARREDEMRNAILMLTFHSESQPMWTDAHEKDLKHLPVILMPRRARWLDANTMANDTDRNRRAFAIKREWSHKKILARKWCMSEQLVADSRRTTSTQGVVPVGHAAALDRGRVRETLYRLFPGFLEEYDKVFKVTNAERDEITRLCDTLLPSFSALRKKTKRPRNARATASSSGNKDSSKARARVGGPSSSKLAASLASRDSAGWVQRSGETRKAVDDNDEFEAKKSIIPVHDGDQEVVVVDTQGSERDVQHVPLSSDLSFVSGGDGATKIIATQTNGHSNAVNEKESLDEHKEAVASSADTSLTVSDDDAHPPVTKEDDRLPNEHRQPASSSSSSLSSPDVAETVAADGGGGGEPRAPEGTIDAPIEATQSQIDDRAAEGRPPSAVEKGASPPEVIEVYSQRVVQSEALAATSRAKEMATGCKTGNNLATMFKKLEERSWRTEDDEMEAMRAALGAGKKRVRTLRSGPLEAANSGVDGGNEDEKIGGLNPDAATAVVAPYPEIVASEYAKSRGLVKPVKGAKREEELELEMEEGGHHVSSDDVTSISEKRAPGEGNGDHVGGGQPTVSGGEAERQLSRKRRRNEAMIKVMQEAMEEEAEESDGDGERSRKKTKGADTEPEEDDEDDGSDVEGLLASDNEADLDDDEGTKAAVAELHRATLEERAEKLYRSMFTYQGVKERRRRQKRAATGEEEMGEVKNMTKRQKEREEALEEEEWKKNGKLSDDEDGGWTSEDDVELVSENESGSDSDDDNQGDDGSFGEIRGNENRESANRLRGKGRRRGDRSRGLEGTLREGKNAFLASEVRFSGGWVSFLRRRGGAGVGAGRSGAVQVAEKPRGAKDDGGPPPLAPASSSGSGLFARNNLSGGGTGLLECLGGGNGAGGEAGKKSGAPVGPSAWASSSWNSLLSLGNTKPADSALS